MIPTSMRSGTAAPSAIRDARASSRSSPGAPDLVHRGDHREHHPERVVGGHPQRRAQLGRQHFGTAQAQADPPEPQVGVRLPLKRKVRERLVGADVERAQRQRAAAEPLGHRAVGRLLLVLGGQVVGGEEQELGAQEADAVGARGHGRADVLGPGHIGLDAHERAVARHGGVVRPRLSLRLVSCSTGTASLERLAPWRPAGPP